MKFNVFRFNRVKSTNDTAIRIINKTNHTLGMVIAETQMKGKGQYGRKWISSKGNLFVSFFNELNNTKLSIEIITKQNCLLVKKLLSKFTKKKFYLKGQTTYLLKKKKLVEFYKRSYF